MKNEVVVFELVGNTISSYEDSMGNRRKSAKSVGIPSQATILYEYPNGDTEIRNIRYMKNQKTIYVDEQPENADLIRQVSSPQFIDGHLAVKPSQSNLLEFLRKHPYNAANQHWDLDRQKVMFKERNPVAIAKELNSKNKQIVNASRLVYDSDFVGKIVPIAEYLGYDTNKESDLILWDIDTYARSNPEKFIDLLDSPMVERHTDITLAQRRGIIKIDGQRVIWSDGRQIVEVPTAFSPKEYFAEISFDEKYKSVWFELKRQLDNRPSVAEDSKTIAAPKTNKLDALSEINTLELIDVLKSNKTITWETPYYLINGKKIKGKDKLFDYVEKNKAELSLTLV